MSWVGCGVGPSFPSYKGKNTLERFLLRGVIGTARAHPVIHMRSLSDLEERNCGNAKPPMNETLLVPAYELDITKVVGW